MPAMNILVFGEDIFYQSTRLGIPNHHRLTMAIDPQAVLVALTPEHDYDLIFITSSDGQQVIERAAQICRGEIFLVTDYGCTQKRLATIGQLDRTVRILEDGGSRTRNWAQLVWKATNDRLEG